MCYFFTTLACLSEPGKFYPGSYTLVMALVDSSQYPILVGGLGQMCKLIQLWRAKLKRASGWDYSLPVGWWHLGHVSWMMMWCRLGCACFMDFLLVNFNISPLLWLLWDTWGKNLPGKNQSPFACFAGWTFLRETAETQNKKCMFCWNPESLLW